MTDTSTEAGAKPLDPALLKTMSGLELMQAMSAGQLPGPPMAVLIGFGTHAIEKGLVIFEGTPGPQHYNPLGSVHGGYAATLLDSCMGCAVHTMLAPGVGYTTLEIKISYLRGMTAKTGPVRAEGRVLQSGRRAAMAEGRLIDAKGNLIAHGTSTCLVFELP